jgi:hypothetical protein
MMDFAWTPLVDLSFILWNRTTTFNVGGSVHFIADGKDVDFLVCASGIVPAGTPFEAMCKLLQLQRIH